MVGDEEVKPVVQEEMATTSADQANSQKNTDSKQFLTQKTEEVSDY